MTSLRIPPERLAEEGIDTVIIAAPDIQGRLAGRRVPAENFHNVVESGVNICLSVWSWDVGQSTVLIETDQLPYCGLHNGIPDATLVPDVATLRKATWLDRTAICLADVVDPATGRHLPISPRAILAAEIERLNSLGFRASAGTELELYLYKNESREARRNGFRNLDPTTLVPSDFMIHEGNIYEPFFHEVRNSLRQSDIPIEAAQSEQGLGQWELTFPHSDPLEMADRHALYKLAFRDMAIKHGWSVTFMAKPTDDQPGSSCHVHLSLSTLDGTPVMFNSSADERMSETMRHAVAGALTYAGDFLAWYAPTVNSYRRLYAGGVAGTSGTWGVDDRTARVRIVGSSASSKRFEFRLPGADANPYLVLAALLASVRKGIEQQLPLTTGPIGDLPAELGAAAGRLRHSQLAQEIIPSTALDQLATIASQEWKVFLAEVSDWDRNRYFDRI